MNKEHEREINRTLVIGWSIITVVLMVAYFFEVQKGETGISYFWLFLVFLMVPYLTGLVFYLHDKETFRLKYTYVFGFMFTYYFILFTGSSDLRFAFAFPMIALLVLYHKKDLIIWFAVLTLIGNGMLIYMDFARGLIDIHNSRNAEIKVALLLLVCIFGYEASRIYQRMYDKNVEATNKITENSLQMRDLVMQTITTVARTIDAKDEYTEGHSQRVAEYSRLLAVELGKTEEEADNIYYVALLHDIGKIGIPDNVLHKPGRLSKEEYELVKQHPTVGADILRDIKAFPGIDIGAHYHHERYDGLGYPEGLKGSQIPEVARIIAVADSYDAMNSNRVYRHHFKKDIIIREIEGCKGSQFDPVIADAMITLIKQNKILDKLSALSAMPERRESTQSKEVEGLLRINKLLLDSLAGDYSERYLVESLSDEMTMNRVISEITDDLKERNNGCLFLLDVDQLRSTNQNHGYLVGDYCLSAIAQVLIRKDLYLLVARMEGDEFLCYMPDVSSIFEARTRLSKIFNDVVDNIRQIPELSRVTISIGASYSRFNGYYFYKLLGAAEKALFQVKQEGDGGFKIFQEAIEHNKADALEKDLDNLAAIIERRTGNNATGSMEYAQFLKAYELFKDIEDGEASWVQLVLFSLQETQDITEEVSERAAAMEYLAEAISSMIRNVDVTARYSNSQQLVLFMNLPDDHVSDVVSRIIREFYRMNTKENFELVYAVRNVALSEVVDDQNEESAKS